MAKKPPDDVSIGKFDILATYAYAKALLDGMDDDEAKQRGMVAAIMGAQARLGIRKEHHEEFQAQKEAAEKKKKTTITAESFDKQVAHKMGRFFEERVSSESEETGRGGAVLRRGEAVGEDPEHLGCQDQRGAVPGAGEGVPRELRNPTQECSFPTVLYLATKSRISGGSSRIAMISLPGGSHSASNRDDAILATCEPTADR